MCQFPERKTINDVLSVKYLMVPTSCDTLPELTKGYTQLFYYNQSVVYERDVFLPFGFCYDTIITETISNALQKDIRERTMIRAALVADSIETGLPSITPEKAASFPTYSAAILALYNNRRRDTLAFSKFENDYFKGSISVDKRSLLFLSIPVNKGWSYYIDGEKATPVVTFKGFTGLILKKGNHTVEGVFYPYGFIVGSIISLCSILIITILLLRKTIIRFFKTRSR